MQIPSKFDVVTNPELFAATLLKIRDKKKRLIPLRWNGVQRKLHHSRTGRDLVLKARQMGVTTYIQAELYRRAVTSSRGTLTLSHDNDSTEKLRLLADTLWENTRMEGARPERKYNNSSLTTYPEFGSAVAIATAGNLKAGRGSTYTDIHGSEVAFWTDAESLMAGAMQGGDPDIILESTPNGAQGWFYELAMDALSGRGVWKLHFYPWWHDPTYSTPLAEGEWIEPTEEEIRLMLAHQLTIEQINWRRNKKSELKRMFSQEYPEDVVECFLTSGDSYFPVEVLRSAFTAPAGAASKPEHFYTAGLDFGQSNDFTYMPVMDRTTNEQVDYLYINKLPWREQRRRIKEMADKWHVGSVLAEVNSIGSVNFEELLHDGVPVMPFETTNASKNALLGRYYDALEHGLKLLDWPVQKSEHYNFTATQLPSGVWRLSAKGEGHDDTVLGNALAMSARERVVETIIIPQRDVLEEMNGAY